MKKPDFYPNAYAWLLFPFFATLALPHLIMGFINEWPVWQALMRAFAGI